MFLRNHLIAQKGINSVLETDASQTSQVMLSQHHEAQPLWYRFQCFHSTGAWQQAGLRKWSPSVLLETRFESCWSGFGQASHMALWDNHAIWISAMEHPLPCSWYNSSFYSILVPMLHRADIFHNEMRYRFTKYWRTEWEIIFSKLDWEVFRIQNWTQFQYHYKNIFISFLITIRDYSW